MESYSHAQPTEPNAKPVRILKDAVCAMGPMNDKSICRVSKASLDSAAELGHLFAAVLCLSIYVFFVPRAPMHHYIPFIFFVSVKNVEI